MKVVNIFEAKTTLSKLIARVIKGEEIIIAKNNKAVAKLSPYSLPDNARCGNQWKGKVSIPPDFDEEDPEISALFQSKNL